MSNHNRGSIYFCGLMHLCILGFLYTWYIFSVNSLLFSLGSLCNASVFSGSSQPLQRLFDLFAWHVS